MNTSAPSRRARAAALLVGALAAATAVVPASAAPPANDSIASPRVVPSIPFRAVQDTRQATSSPSDGGCVGGSSVWYRFRPATTGWARVVTIGSDYDTWVSVFRGPRNNRTEVACNDDAAGLQSAVGLRFEAGRTYWVAVSACCDSTARGGTAVVRLYRPRPAGVDVAVTGVESGAVSGRLFVEGTLTCSTPSLGPVEVYVSQRVGTVVARGGGYAVVDECTLTPSTWRARVDSETAHAFQPGRVAVDLTAYSVDGFTTVTEQMSMVEDVADNPNARSVR
jgi:hypothetical protein